MAEKKEGEAAKEGAPAAGKKKNPKVVMLAGVGALVLALAGGGAWFFLKPKPDAPATTEDGKEAPKKDEKKEEKKVPFFVEFEPFTVNLKDPDRFLQIKITFQVKTAEAAEQLKDLMPIVRSAVIPVLAAQELGTITTKEGKDKMCEQVVAATNESLATTPAADQVVAALITHMIIQ